MRTTERLPDENEEMGIDSLIFVIVVCVILSLTVISNIFVLVIMLKIPKMLNPTNVLICNLTISDIVLSGVVIPQNIHDITHSDVNYFEGDFSCRLVNFSPILCILASIYTMVAMSFERKRAIIITQEQSSTTKQAVVAIPIIWFLSLMFCIPTIYEYGQYVEDTGNGTFITRCGNSGVSRTYSIINGTGILLLAYIVPLVVIMVNYGSILLFFRSRGMLGSKSASDTLTTQAVSRGRMNVVKMLVFVAALFAISWLPYFILLVIEKATGKSNLVESNGAVNKLRIALAVFSTAYNFVLNIVYNRNFRNGFKALVTCQKVIFKRNTILPADARNSMRDQPNTSEPGRSSVIGIKKQAKKGAIT